MAFLSWHERYSVGNAEIDAQHKVIFDLVNRFDDTVQMGTKSVVRFLADWLTNHIIREDLEYKPYLKG